MEARMKNIENKLLKITDEYAVVDRNELTEVKKSLHTLLNKIEMYRKYTLDLELKIAELFKILNTAMYSTNNGDLKSLMPASKPIDIKPPITVPTLSFTDLPNITTNKNDFVKINSGDMFKPRYSSLNK